MPRRSVGEALRLLRWIKFKASTTPSLLALLAPLWRSAADDSWNAKQAFETRCLL